MICLKCGHPVEGINDEIYGTRDYDSLPLLNITSSETNIPHLTSSDVDLHTGPF